MSMLEEIQAAEAQGKAELKEATLNARKLVRAAEEKAQQEANSMIMATRSKGAEVIAAADKAAQEKSKDLVKQNQYKDQAEAANANAKLSEIVSYILEKVVV